MRYWQPFAGETGRGGRGLRAGRDRAAAALSAVFDDHDRLVADGLAARGLAAGLTGRPQPSAAIPAEPGFVAAHGAAAVLGAAGRSGQVTPRLLFSAHGLPQKIVDARRSLSGPGRADRGRGRWPRLPCRTCDWRVCYQSRVGPLEWIGPSTDDGDRAGPARDGVAVLVVPIAFVSEHSRPWSSSTSNIAELAQHERRAGLSPGADGRCATRASSTAWPTRCAARWRRPGGLRGRAATGVCPADRMRLSARHEGIDAWISWPAPTLGSRRCTSSR